LPLKKRRLDGLGEAMPGRSESWAGEKDGWARNFLSKKSGVSGPVEGEGKKKPLAGTRKYLIGCLGGG